MFGGKELLFDIVIAPKIGQATNLVIPGKFVYAVRVFTGSLQKREVLVNPATGWGITGFSFDTQEELIKFITDNTTP